MTGHITDGVGFIRNLKEHGVEGQKMVIIGTVFIEDLDNKEKLAEVVSESNILVNATRAGMAPLENVIPEPEERFRPELAVADVVYNLLETLLVKKVKEAGSGLSISEIASVTNRPDKVMGAHFFYPAPVMKLLELVRGLVTSDETYDVVKEFAGKIGKTTVDAPEFPGFMVNRILVPMQNEAAFMVMEGSKPEDVDNAMKLGCNHPMGPIELTDFVGIDTMLATMTGLYNGFHDSKYRPCPLLETMVKSGMLGKKTGQGFYKYDEKGNKIGSNF